MKMKYHLIYNICVTVPSFVSQPNVVNSYRGESTTLTWSLSEPVNSRWRYIDLQYDLPRRITVLSFTFNTNRYQYGQGYDANRVKGDIKVNSTTISFTLFNLQPDDARYRYSCGVKYDTFKDAIINNNGWILLYYVPHSLTINYLPSEVTENTILTLTCSASSTTIFPSNIPKDLSPKIDMKYRWQRDNYDLPNDNRHRVNGNKLIIDRIQRMDNNITYRCIAQELGSRLSNYKDITLNVMYKPGAAKADVDTVGPYFEGYPENINLSCSISDPGNPKVKFEWLKDGKHKDYTDTNYYTISSGQLTVSGHDGLWQCLPYNNIGNGEPDTIKVTVYCPPSWYKLDPVDHVNGVSIGDTTNFKVWVIARPLPRQDQWKWKFSPSNSSNVMTTDPGHVHLTVSDDMAVLSITNVTISYYGKLPFGDVTDDEARQKVLKGQRPIKPTKCSDDMFDIMTQCWMRQPFKRPSLRDISVKCNELIEYEEV
ncbi:hypothetical protein LSH36_2049g00034 [Paralvinella palmiformis]|uniref:Ig-like domain-containing protein n=1 Tax=Paralvinella palmiformis TaxID=53620 RepID=A0AAD9IQE0_9ANNE|nr:hypothetical protein LSH36_2049g00034 [Paralvinella palmiformis]